MTRTDPWPVDRTHAAPSIPPPVTAYPRKDAAGRIYWACCVSSIGPKCRHRS